MKEINVKGFSDAIELLEAIRSNVAEKQFIGSQDLSQTASCLSILLDFSRSLDLRDAVFTIHKALTWFSVKQKEGSWLTANAHIEYVQLAITTQIGDVRFFAIAKDRIQYYDNAELFGLEVLEGFPSARFDLLEAVNCIAVDRNTAAVFHLMRVSEYGLRALARDRRVVVPKSANIELATWEQIIRELEDSEEKIFQMPKTLAREQQFAFYHGAMMEIRRFKNVWRNNIMHARDEYDRDQAVGVLNNVREFMKILASRISEGGASLPETWGPDEVRS